MKVMYYEDGTAAYSPELGDHVRVAIELDSRTLQQYAAGEAEIGVSVLYRPGQPATTRAEVIGQPAAASETTAKEIVRRERVARLRAPIRVNGISITAARRRRRAVPCTPRPRTYRTRRTRRHTGRRRATSRDDGGDQDGEPSAATTGTEVAA